MIVRGGDILSFRNPAELKEDTLRHLSPYQCQGCGKRFGKRYACTRHGKKQSPCKPVEGVIWISSELRSAVKGLEDARGYDSVMAAIQKCKHICNGQPIQRIQDDYKNTLVTAEAASLGNTELSGPVGLHETTRPNSLHSPPGLQRLSSLPPEYPADEIAEQTPGLFLFSAWPWTPETSTVLSNDGIDDIEWAQRWDELPSSTNSY